jgi:hypothetical protein
MNVKQLLTPVAVAAALSLAALPAGADQRPRGNQDRGGGRAVARQAAPRNDNARASAPRQQAQPRAQERREVAPRAPERREVAPRAYGNRQPEVRQYSGRPEYRGQGRAYAAPRYHAPSYRAVPRPYYRSYVPYRPHFFVRPYYAFRPRLSIGFGLWLGFPVPYPYSYVAAYPPPVYGYDGGAVTATPDAVYGGVSFDLTPPDAGVWVDGEYVGTVGDFPPNAAPLTLTLGQHRIEVRADGYRPMAWDVDVTAGQVIPFRGALQPY